MNTVPKKDRVGEKYFTNMGEEIEVIVYRNAKDCDVRVIKTGHIITNREFKDVSGGSIKDPFYPSVCGVGYVGIGENRIRYANGNINKAYEIWRDMLRRCYVEDRRELSPTYKDVMVCPEWHNFQVFAEWYNINHKIEYMEGWQLDKDILCKDCKEYSPDNCCFVPRKINNAVMGQKSKKSDYPIGISTNNKGFKARTSTNKGRVDLGTFPTIEQAFQAYKTAKEVEIKRVAEEYKGLITDKVYEALMNYEVDILD